MIHLVVLSNGLNWFQTAAAAGGAPVVATE
jgi:hypothetical protein